MLVKQFLFVLLISQLIHSDNSNTKIDLKNHWIIFVDASGSVVNPLSKARSYRRFLQDSLISILKNLKGIPAPMNQDYYSVVYFGIVPNNNRLIESDTITDSVACKISFIKNYKFYKDYLHVALTPGIYNITTLKKNLYPKSPHYCFTFLSIAEPSVFYYLNKYGKRLKRKNIRKTFLVLVSDDNYNDYECYHELRFLREVGGAKYLQELKKFENKYYLDLVVSKSYRVKQYTWGLYLYELKNLKAERFFSQYAQPRGLKWIDHQSLSSNWIKPKVTYRFKLSENFVNGVFSNFRVIKSWINMDLTDTISLNKYSKVVGELRPNHLNFTIRDLPIPFMEFTFRKKVPKVLLNLKANFLIEDNLLGSYLMSSKESSFLKRPMGLAYIGKLSFVILTIFIIVILLIVVVENFTYCYELPVRFRVSGIPNPVSFGEVVEPLRSDYGNFTVKVEWINSKAEGVFDKVPVLTRFRTFFYGVLYIFICRRVLSLMGIKVVKLGVKLINDESTEPIAIDWNFNSNNSIDIISEIRKQKELKDSVVIIKEIKLLNFRKSVPPLIFRYKHELK